MIRFPKIEVPTVTLSLTNLTGAQPRSLVNRDICIPGRRRRGPPAAAGSQGLLHPDSGSLSH